MRCLNRQLPRTSYIYAVKHSTSISFYPNGIFFSCQKVIIFKSSNETIPIITGNGSIINAQHDKFFLQSSGCFQVAFSQNKTDYFAAFSVIGILVLRTKYAVDQPNLVGFTSYVSPKFINFQAFIIIFLGRDHSMGTCQNGQYFIWANVFYF